ncbi:MAG: MerR family transcriptional regulator [Lachnospiraceae bacterium]|nr:MerR family transcriptional regulator [Lachnospiraceae bacterium]
MENKKVYLISDASRKVKVESHVLRYWEDELKLPVKRNELGHRYYTEEDIMEFQEIKKLKEQGLQLKAIRMILKNGKLTRLPDVEKLVPTAQTAALPEREAEEKVKRLEYLMKKLISEAVQESNEKLYEELSETLTKELDYQFRMQEEREEQRESKRLMLEEEHYKQLDILLRGKSGRKKQEKQEKQGKKERKKLFKKTGAV